MKDPIIFGSKKISKAEYLSALEEIFNHQADWVEWIDKNFERHEVYGKDQWGEVLSTGYYEPKVRGSKKATDIFSQPVYATPADLVSIDLKAFSYKFTKGLEHNSLTGRISNKKIVPYFVRKEIDSDKKLDGQDLEIAWIDPVDSFFIQIQGSGVIEFDDGDSIRIGYANQNGHPYVAIGKHLTHVIPLNEMSMQRIRAYLKTLSSLEQQDILNINPSYVFFKKLETLALTYTGAEVSDGRTIATDKLLMPKGALAWLDIEEPVFLSESSTEPISWERRPRLVFDQDTGGAIKGPGRVDLYYGNNESAAQKAGVMRRLGKLYYLVPKSP
jgi:membrane-bound lytic murein transglycosylase A